MWSTKNPPDELEDTSQIYDIEEEFNISLSQEAMYALYDMELDEATEVIIKIMNEKNDNKGTAPDAKKRRR